MSDFFRVPLAWLNLVHEKRRFAISLGGICFAVLLMFMEYGFWNAIFDSAVAVLRQLDADLILTSKARYSLVVSHRFPRGRLYQARAVKGVLSARPLYVEYHRSEWKNPEAAAPANAPVRPIRVLAFDPDHTVLRLRSVNDQLDKLRLPDTALIDVDSKREYGRLTPGTERELANRLIRVVGTFRLGTDFATNGNVIVSDVTFARLFPGRDLSGTGTAGATEEQPRPDPLSVVDLGIIKVSPEADRLRVRAALQAALPGDVAVFTLDEYVQQEMNFWATVSPIGFVFGLGMVMGFVIGAVICYQILSADVDDHLAEYATLKGIGYRNRFLTQVVLQEALLLSILGFIPGLFLGWLLYAGVWRWTGLPLDLTLARSSLILVLTVAMCVLSGIIAVQRVKSADPAEVF